LREDGAQAFEQLDDALIRRLSADSKLFHGD
jgi:hypothetical protein